MSSIAFRLRLVPLRTREGCSLSLSDIFLYSDGEALNLDSASGTFDGGEADAALDGNASTQFDDPNCSGVEVAMPSPTRVDAVSFVTAEGKDSIPSDLVAFRIEAHVGKRCAPVQQRLSDICRGFISMYVYL